MYLHRLSLFAAIFLLSALHIKAQDTLTLQEAIGTGLANNYGLRLVKNDLRIAENNNTPGNAGFLPIVSANGTFSNTVNDTRQQFFNGETRQGDNARSSSLSAGLQLQWTVFDGFSMFVERDRLGQLVDFNNAEMRAQIENTVVNITHTYYEIVRQERIAEVLKEVVSISGRRRFIAETKSNIGAGSKLASLQASADFNADTAQLVRQLSVITQYKTELNRLLALDPATQILVSRVMPLQRDLNQGELQQTAEAQNPDLTRARISLQLAELDIRSARSGRYPRLTVFGGYNFNQSMNEVGLLQLNRNIGPQYGVTASVPIFNGFNTNRQVQNARILRESGQLQYDQALLDIRSSLYTAYVEYQSQLTLVNLENANLEVAQKTASAAEERYKVGNLSDIDFRLAQLSLRDSEIRLLDALYNAKRSETELLRLSGQLSR